MVCRHLHIAGRVQGVAFRWYARERARELGLCGWVRNLSDGRVEVWLEGEGEAVAQMERWLEQGPPGARVAAIEGRDEEPQGLPAFEVRTGR